MSDFERPHLMAMRDLAFDISNNKVSMASVPKPPKEAKFKPKPIKLRDYPVFKDTPEYLAELADKDLTFDMQLDKIAMNAIPEKGYTVADKVKSNITQEMISEYQKEHSKPTIGPDGQLLKYRPASVSPQLENPILIKTLSEARKEEILDELRLEEEYRARATETLPIVLELIRELQDNLGNEIDPAIIRRYQRDLNIEERRARDIQDFLSNNARTQQLQRLLNQNESTQRANEIEDVRVREINRNKLKNMYEELKFLNSGEYIMEQQPGETEQEFQQRLMNIGATTVNESSIEKNAIMQNIETAKKNLRELTSSEGKISTVIKMLEPPEMRYAFNKRFPAIKKKFIETYGANNANVSDKDIYDFIESELQGKYERATVGQLIDLLPEEAPKEVRELSAPFIQKAPKVRESTETKQANAELRRQELKLERERKINEAQAKGALSRRLASEEKRREEIDFPIFSKYATAQPVQALPQLPDYYLLPAAAEEVNPLTVSSLERRFESFKEPTQRVSSKQILIDHLRVAFPGLEVSKRAQIGNLTEGQRASTSTEKILTKLADQDPATFYTLPPEIYAQFSPNDKAVYNRIKKEVDEGTFKGTGIKVDYNHNQYPLKFQLGKIIYEPQRLFEHNILSLKSLKGQSMPGLKNVRVSDALSNILVRMSANNMPNKGDLSVLNDSEREMYDNIIAMSGLKKTTINTFEDTVPKMKKRLGLIEGEIEAGNTNRALLDEARTIIYNMARSKLISRGAADNHIKQLRQYFR